MSQPQIAERVEAARKIKSSPNNYKVCECCGSIVVAKSPVCPNCSAYRFDTTHQAVITQAEFLASRAPLSIESKDYI
ncbi:MAG: hypothetical protein AAF984_00180 [Verrucomicrobiota bacterium]